jgi:hypothetical protein
LVGFPAKGLLVGMSKPKDNFTKTEALDVFGRRERILLSERDILFVLDLLEYPPPPNAKLIAAAQAWEENQRRLKVGEYISPGFITF